MYWDDKYGTHTVSADVSHHFRWLLQLLLLYFTPFLFYCPRLSKVHFYKTVRYNDVTLWLKDYVEMEWVDEKGGDLRLVFL